MHEHMTDLTDLPLKSLRDTGRERGERGPSRLATQCRQLNSSQNAYSRTHLILKCLRHAKIWRCLSSAFLLLYQCWQGWHQSESFVLALQLREIMVRSHINKDKNAPRLGPRSRLLLQEHSPFMPLQKIIGWRHGRGPPGAGRRRRDSCLTVARARQRTTRSRGHGDGREQETELVELVYIPEPLWPLEWATLLSKARHDCERHMCAGDILRHLPVRALNPPSPCLQTRILRQDTQLKAIKAIQKLILPGKILSKNCIDEDIFLHCFCVNNSKS